jgi:hypothetical protein
MNDYENSQDDYNSNDGKQCSKCKRYTLFYGIKFKEDVCDLCQEFFSRFSRKNI